MRLSGGLSKRGVSLAGVLGLMASVAVVVALPSSASASPVIRQVRVPGTDWVSAGVGGIGSAASGGGKGTIKLSGISGRVTGAWLSWNGIGPFNKAADVYEGSYNNPDIKVNGHAVVGVSQGESGSNCWGDDASSRTYLANVTKIAQRTRNGAYHLTGLGNHGDANGASLVVTFQDGKHANNQDLYLYYGDDTDHDGYPGEDFVWNDTLDRIAYAGGPVQLQLAVADGQNFGPTDDGALTVTGKGGPLTFDDTPANHDLWDGTTVPDAGHSRAQGATGFGSLYDLETFDVTSAFTSAKTQTLAIGTPFVEDCHSLTMAALSVKATGHQPLAPRTVSVEPASVKEGTGRVHCHHRHCSRYTAMNFHVVLSRAFHRPVWVKLHTADGTATAPSDYIKRSATVSIPAHHLSTTFRVNIVRDNVPELDELLYAEISSARVSVATAVAVGTIRNDDGTARSPATRVGEWGGWR
jgi:hypothetical protein